MYIIQLSCITILFLQLIVAVEYIYKKTPGTRFKSKVKVELNKKSELYRYYYIQTVPELCWHRSLSVVVVYHRTDRCPLLPNQMVWELGGTFETGYTVRTYYIKSLLLLC